MMYLPFILVALLKVKQPEIDIVDSIDDSKIVYIIVNNTCKIAVDKVELKDYDKVVNTVMAKCGF